MELLDLPLLVLEEILSHVSSVLKPSIKLAILPFLPARVLPSRYFLKFWTGLVTRWVTRFRTAIAERLPA